MRWSLISLHIFCSTCRVIITLRVLEFPESLKHITNLKQIDTVSRKRFTSFSNLVIREPELQSRQDSENKKYKEPLKF